MENINIDLSIIQLFFVIDLRETVSQWVNQRYDMYNPMTYFSLWVMLRLIVFYSVFRGKDFSIWSM